MSILFVARFRQLQNSIETKKNFPVKEQEFYSIKRNNL